MRPGKQNKSVDDIVIWMTECTLATVAGILLLKRYSERELQRQINIAQVGVDYVKTLERPQKNRLREVISRYDGSVSAWASNQCMTSANTGNES